VPTIVKAFSGAYRHAIRATHKSANHTANISAFFASLPEAFISANQATQFSAVIAAIH